MSTTRKLGLPLIDSGIDISVDHLKINEVSTALDTIISTNIDTIAENTQKIQDLSKVAVRTDTANVFSENQHITREGGSAEVVVKSTHGNSGLMRAGVVLQGARGTQEAMLPLQKKDFLGRYTFAATDEGGQSVEAAYLRAVATQNHRNGTFGTQLEVATTANNTTKPQVRGRVRQDGTLEWLQPVIVGGVDIGAGLQETVSQTELTTGLAAKADKTDAVSKSDEIKVKDGRIRYNAGTKENPVWRLADRPENLLYNGNLTSWSGADTWTNVPGLAPADYIFTWKASAPTLYLERISRLSVDRDNFLPHLPFYAKFTSALGLNQTIGFMGDPSKVDGQTVTAIIIARAERSPRTNLVLEARRGPTVGGTDFEAISPEFDLPLNDWTVVKFTMDIEASGKTYGPDDFLYLQIKNKKDNSRHDIRVLCAGVFLGDWTNVENPEDLFAEEPSAIKAINDRLTEMDAKIPPPPKIYDAYISDERPNGVNGQASTTTWSTKEFNTEFDPDGIVALSNNEITPSVDCEMQGWCYTYASREGSLRIVEDGSSTPVAVGTSARSDHNYAATATMNFYCRLEAGKTYSIQTKVERAFTRGQGTPGSHGITELYAFVGFRKL